MFKVGDLVELSEVGKSKRFILVLPDMHYTVKSESGGCLLLTGAEEGGYYLPENFMLVKETTVDFNTGDKVRLNAKGRGAGLGYLNAATVYEVAGTSYSRIFLKGLTGDYYKSNFELVKEDEMKFKVGDYAVITSDYYASLRDRVCKIHRVDSPKNIYVGVLDGPSSFEKAGLWTVTEDELISLMDLDKPFKVLSDEVKVALFTAYVKGAQVQYCYGSKWVDTKEPMWAEDSRYRIAPVAKPDSIDWSQVDNRFKYMARAKDGWVSLFEDKPFVSGDSWYASSGLIGAQVTQPSYVQGDVDWKDSLICR